MTSAERRQRHRAELRSRILQAALDLVSEQGLGALSIRAIAERIEYSSAALYLYFDSKEALLREVARDGFRRFDEALAAAGQSVPADAEPHEVMRALGQAYVAFALQNTAYFRVMFDLPAVPRLLALPRNGGPAARPPGEASWQRLRAAVHALVERGAIGAADEAAGWLSAWALLHGLVTLYLSGHLAAFAPDHESFRALVDRTLRDHGRRFMTACTP